MLIPGWSTASLAQQPMFMTFDAVESFIAAFTPHAATLQGDMPNYTNIVPVIQFNEVLLSQ